MTDDLVKLGRAVERDLNNGFPMDCEKGRIIQQMAARIEELEAKLARADAQLREYRRIPETPRVSAVWADRALRAEAKLAKAVDTLSNIAVTGYSDDLRVAAAIAKQAVDQARATLADLKGGKE